jgi:hypothetical protein
VLYSSLPRLLGYPLRGRDVHGMERIRATL